MIRNLYYVVPIGASARVRFLSSTQTSIEPAMAALLFAPTVLAMTGIASKMAAPVLPGDFYAGVQTNVVVTEGEGVTYDSDAVCCAKGTHKCKVETISEGAGTWEQASKKRLLIRGGATGIQTKWFGKTDKSHPAQNKQMFLVPGAEVNSTHKWACAAYCPLRGKDFVSSIVIAPDNERVKDLGVQNKSQ